MVEKNLTENLNKKDLDLILEVNRKAVEMEMEVAAQNEELIKTLTTHSADHKKQTELAEKLLKLSEELSKDMFKLQILFVTGLFSIVAQIISIFVKK